MRTLSIDCETTGPALHHGCLPFFVSTCDDKGTIRCWEWSVDPFTRNPQIPPKDMLAIVDLIAKYPRLVCHHAKFDVRALRLIGIDLTNRWEDIHDTLLMSHVLNSGEPHGLKELSLKYLHILDDDERALEKQVKHLRLTTAKYKGWKLGPDWHWDYWLPKAADPNSTLLAEYAKQDARRTMLLYLSFFSEINAEGLRNLYERERQLQAVVYLMESKGFPVNPRTIKRLITQLSKKVNTNLTQITNSQAAKSVAKECHATKKTGGVWSKPEPFNPGSPKQLKSLLFDRLGFTPVRYTDKGNESTDFDTLVTIWTEQLGNYCDEDGNDRQYNGDQSVKAKIVDNLLSLRNYSTSHNYCEGYLTNMLPKGSDHVVYGSLNQTGTRGTRFSSSNPNLQNIDKQLLRQCFIPRQGTFWLDCDYANLELRIYAVMSGEDWLLKAFDAGTNVMKMLAKEIWGSDYTKPQYQRVKNGSYARLYGATQGKADITYGKAGACQVFDEMFNIRKTTETIKKEFRKNGDFLHTMFGYKVYPQSGKEYSLLNPKIQGTAGDILKEAMLNCERALPDIPLLMCVHDELIFEVTTNYLPSMNKSIKIQAIGIFLEKITEQMIEPGKRVGIPLAVGVDLVMKHWGDRKEIKI